VNGNSDCTFIRTKFLKVYLNLDICSVSTNWTDLFLMQIGEICQSLFSTTLFSSRLDRIVKQALRNRREERSNYKAQAHAKSTCQIPTKHVALSRPLFALTPHASCFHLSILFKARNGKNTVFGRSDGVVYDHCTASPPKSSRNAHDSTMYLLKSSCINIF
jgi:hypothetical protein